MSSEQHLGNADELTSFMTAMCKELKKHQSEKNSMRNWDFESVMLNDNPEIVKRIDMIIKANVDIKNDLFHDRKVDNLRLIMKQSVHIANYCMMSYLKTVEELKK